MPAYIIAILVSLICSILGLTVKENRPGFFYFPFFLLVTFFIEYLSWKLSQSGKNNVLIYNLFTLVEFTFYLFFLKFLLRKFYKRSLFLLYVIIAYVIVTVINIFFYQGKAGFHTYTYILGCLLIVILCITYFNFMFRFTVTGSLIREPVFWIVTGLLFYYACSFPVFGIMNFIIKIPTHFYRILLFIINFANISLYLLFSIGFLCKINFRKLLRL